MRVIDTIGPRSTGCPAKTSRRPTDKGKGFAVVTWAVVFTDNVVAVYPPRNATCQLDVGQAATDSIVVSGARFPVGVTRVVCTAAADAAGNTAAPCTFDIVVIDEEPPIVMGCPSGSTVSLAPATPARWDIQVFDNVDRPLIQQSASVPAVGGAIYSSSDTSEWRPKCWVASGTLYPVVWNETSFSPGTAEVSCDSPTDAAGNQGPRCQFLVSVVPKDVIKSEAGGCPNGTIVVPTGLGQRTSMQGAWDVSITTGKGTKLLCGPTRGFPLPVGTHTVICSIIYSDNNWGNATVLPLSSTAPSFRTTTTPPCRSTDEQNTDMDSDTTFLGTSAGMGSNTDCGGGSDIVIIPDTDDDSNHGQRRLYSRRTGSPGRRTQAAAVALPSPICQFRVTVVDREPPYFVGCPGALVPSNSVSMATASNRSDGESTRPLVPAASLVAAIDNVDGIFAATCGTVYRHTNPTATGAVVCTATDLAGNKAPHACVINDDAPSRQLAISGCPSGSVMSVGATRSRTKVCVVALNQNPKFPKPQLHIRVYPCVSYRHCIMTASNCLRLHHTPRSLGTSPSSMK